MSALYCFHLWEIPGFTGLYWKASSLSIKAFFFIYCRSSSSAKVVFKGLLTSDWQVKKDFKVKQMLDVNVPNYESEHVHTARKTSTIFTNQQKLEREGMNYVNLKYECIRQCFVRQRIIKQIILRIFSQKINSFIRSAFEFPIYRWAVNPVVDLDTLLDKNHSIII